MLRALLKTGISASLAWSGGAGLVGRLTGKQQYPLVLGYHRVVEDYTYSSQYAICSSLVSTRTLVRQLEWIARRYDICSLDELQSRHESGVRHGKPPAAITFDDGYADVYHNAMPTPLKKGMPLPVFVTTDLLENQALFAHDELYLRLAALMSRTEKATARVGEILRNAGCWTAISGELPAVFAEPYRLTRAMLGSFRQEEIRTVVDILRSHTQLPRRVAEQSSAMNWAMLKDMQRAGVLIGCHSKSHAILTNEDKATVSAEVEEGRTVLESRLGVPVKHFAYPDGAFNDTVVRAVAKAGYRHAYTVCFHRSSVAPPLTMPRRLPLARTKVNLKGHFSGTIMTCQVNGVFDARAGCAAGHG